MALQPSGPGGVKSGPLEPTSVTDVQPKGEALRRAVRWLSERGDYGAEAIDEAARRFDLSPLEEEFLLTHFLHADRRPRP